MLVNLSASQFPPLENGNGAGSYLASLLWVTEETIQRKCLAEASFWQWELFAQPTFSSLCFVSAFSSEIVKEGHPGHHVQGGGRPHGHKGPHRPGAVVYPEDEQMRWSLRKLRAASWRSSADEGLGPT